MIMKNVMLTEILIGNECVQFKKSLRQKYQMISCMGPNLFKRYSEFTRHFLSSPGVLTTSLSKQSLNTPEQLLLW